MSVMDLSEDLLPVPNKDLRYLAVPQLSSRSPLLQELLLSGIHYQTPSPRWLRFHPSESPAVCYIYNYKAELTGIGNRSSI